MVNTLIDTALSTLKNSGIIVLPTDTVWGLAVDPANRMALQKLYKLKKCDANTPLVYLVHSPKLLDDLVYEITPTVKDLMAQYWPGALTIIFRRKYSAKTIGVRIPNSQWLLSLLSAWGKPLVVTGTGLDARIGGSNLQQLRCTLGSGVDLYVPESTPCSGVPSTVVDVSAGEIKIIRQGEIKL